MGIYDLTKVDDCARLVLSVKPNKQRAAYLLACVERMGKQPFMKVPERVEILSKIKELDK